VAVSTTSKPIIATGHQPCWHHCGIWSKTLAVSKLAEAVGGIGLHLVVDHDPCQTTLLLPEKNAGGRWFLEEVAFEAQPRPDIPLEFRKPPEQAHLRYFFCRVAQMFPDALCTQIWLQSKKTENNLPQVDNLADLVTFLQALLNKSLGVRVMYLPVSRLAESNAFMDFAASVITDAYSFVKVYNSAVDESSNRQYLPRHHPVRYLIQDKDTGGVELPFWLFSPEGRRYSLFVTRDNNSRIIVSADGLVPISLNPTNKGLSSQLRDELRKHGYRLRPKAVTLTLFVRLFLADWFVHGLGGASYEFVTDRIIEDYYGISGLRFGIVTANVKLPIPTMGDESTESISALKDQLRDLKYHPEKYIPASAREKRVVRSLLEQKWKLIRLASDKTLPSAARNSAWQLISEVNEKLIGFAQPNRRSLEQKLKLAESKLQSNYVCNWREYFFGLFPRKKLNEITQSLSFAADKAVYTLE